MLLITDCRLIIVTPLLFANVFNKKLQVSYIFIFLTHYLMELSMNYVEYLEHKPSFLAAASIVLARLCIMPHENPWPNLLNSFGKHS